MKVLTIAYNSLRRLLRDRSNIFFVFLMPLLLILILGAAFGGSYDPRVGVVVIDTGELGDELYSRIESTDGVIVSAWTDRDEMILAVERGGLDGGVVVPDGYTEQLLVGQTASIEWVGRTDENAMALRNTIDSVVVEQGALLRAAAFADAQGVTQLKDALADAREISVDSESIVVDQRSVGEPFIFDTMGRFELGAYSQLLLFIYLTSMTGAAALIQSRQLGVSERMLSTPTSIGTILAGEALGRFLVAGLQGLLIMGGTALFFGVDWGDPLGATAVFVLFALGASGVGLLMGAVFKNDQQAGGVGVMLGIGLGALGGAMLPLSIMKVFSPTLWQVAHITPHAWGIEAFEKLILQDAGVADIWLELGVLAAFAIVAFALGMWRLRVSLTRR